MCCSKQDFRWPRLSVSYQLTDGVLEVAEARGVSSRAESSAPKDPRRPDSLLPNPGLGSLLKKKALVTST